MPDSRVSTEQVIDYSLSLHILAQAGLEADWQTIYQGWHGFPGEWDAFRLSAADVQQFAVEHLGTSDAETDYRLVRLIDAEPTQRRFQAEEDTLRLLAAGCGVDEATARHKWQYALLVRLAASMEATSVLDAADPYDYLDWQYDVHRMATDIEGILPGTGLPVLGKGMLQDDVAALREWLFWQAAALEQA